jgi:hypothetical protein
MRALMAHGLVLAVERLEWLLARAGALVSLLVLITVGHAAVKVVPPYAAHYRLHDRASEIVRAYSAHNLAPGDTPELRSGLMEAVRDLGLDSSIGEGDFQIESTISRMRVSCRYEVAVEIVPGRKHRLHFRLDVEEPVLPKPETKFL